MKHTLQERKPRTSQINRIVGAEVGTIQMQHCVFIVGNNNGVVQTAQTGQTDYVQMLLEHIRRQDEQITTLLHINGQLINQLKMQQ